MKELSLHILDIAENSVNAGAGTYPSRLKRIAQKISLPSN
jgi:hypothetical protein